MTDTRAPPAASNRLAAETSPYLLQHATNPVDWYPWSEEAFAEARSSGKPVLLSIGYSACHWCHVMAHESFEDPATATVMNEHFINIKVDREERPDVDRIYQLAHQLLTRRGGGWPLTMFLTADQKPFFGGTYFPPVPGHGLPGFRSLLGRVAQYYREQRDALQEQNDALLNALASIDAPASPATEPLTSAPLQLLRSQLEARFDRQHGGFTQAPKFPHAGMISSLLRDWHASAATATPDLQALFMATLSLTRMANGGLFDQLGGGFYRYSVDERWEIPHFEKMLYDNGLLLSVYADAAAATGDEAFAQIVIRTAEFLLREMRAPDGALYSSFDADSEGHEGLYYLWTPDQITAALGTAATPFLKRHGMDSAPNFEGAWHLIAARDIPDLARESGMDTGELSQQLEASRQQLLGLRDQRVAPARDDKILTAWNALAIKGLCDAARALDRRDLAQTADTALAWLRAHHWKNGRLLATSKDGIARLPAYLDDHAFLIDAILSLLTVRYSSDALQFAIQLADALLLRFADREHGGFYFTAEDHETLIHRSRSFSDDATPSGNAIAASALQRLGWLLGRSDYLDAATRALRAAWPTLSEAPLAQVHMAGMLRDYLQPHAFVILRGEAEQMRLWQRELQRGWRPDMSVIAIPADATGLPSALAEKIPVNEVVGYLCRGSVCAAPETNLAALLKALSAEG
jgi:uncharacterized protein